MRAGIFDARPDDVQSFVLRHAWMHSVSAALYFFVVDGLALQVEAHVRKNGSRSHSSGSPPWVQPGAPPTSIPR